MQPKELRYFSTDLSDPPISFPSLDLRIQHNQGLGTGLFRGGLHAGRNSEMIVLLNRAFDSFDRHESIPPPSAAGTTSHRG